jgi:hypothetical protein
LLRQSYGIDEILSNLRVHIPDLSYPDLSNPDIDFYYEVGCPHLMPVDSIYKKVSHGLANLISVIAENKKKATVRVTKDLLNPG